MTKEEWLAEAAKISKCQENYGDTNLENVRRALIDIDNLFNKAPTMIQQSYKSIAEGALRHFCDRAIANLYQGTFSWLQRDLVEAAAAQARALDCYLYEQRYFRGKPNDANKDFLCSINNMHAIPRQRASPPSNPTLVSTGTYKRRGVIWHRIIPSVTNDGYKINLEWHRDLFVNFREKEPKVMAALFKNISLVRSPMHEKFVAADAPCDDDSADIQSQLDMIYRQDILLGLWPELTMPPYRRCKLAAALRDKAKSNFLGRGPSFVAAGSWHEVHDGIVRNRMHILSRSGLHRFYHDKSLPLQSTSLGEEEIQSDYSIPILIGEDILVAFAICRDFCEAQISRVYAELNVDLIIVPSYGDRKTILAHRQQAQNLSTASGASTFVVQQIVPEEVAASGLGYVIPPSGKIADTTACSLVINDSASVHPLAFKKV